MIGVELWTACVAGFRAHLDSTIGLSQVRQVVEAARKRWSLRDYVDQQLQEELLECSLPAYQNLALRLIQLRQQCAGLEGVGAAWPAAITVTTATASARQLPVFPSIADDDREASHDHNHNGGCRMVVDDEEA